MNSPADRTKLSNKQGPSKAQKRRQMKKKRRKKQLANEKTLFLGGIPLDITNEELFEYFSQYGSILRVAVSKKSPEETINMGYGYLETVDMRSLQKIRQKDFYMINNRKVEVKPYFRKGKQKSEILADVQNRRIYINNLPDSWKDSDLRNFFSKFGPLENCYMLKDSQKKKNIDDAYLLYKRGDDCAKLFDLTKEQKVVVEGVVVTSRKAKVNIPKQDLKELRSKGIIVDIRPQSSADDKSSEKKETNSTSEKSTKKDTSSGPEELSKEADKSVKSAKKDTNSEKSTKKVASSEKLSKKQNSSDKINLDMEGGKKQKKRGNEAHMNQRQAQKPMNRNSSLLRTNHYERNSFLERLNPYSNNGQSHPNRPEERWRAPSMRPEMRENNRRRNNQEPSHRFPSKRRNQPHNRPSGSIQPKYRSETHQAQNNQGRGNQNQKPMNKQNQGNRNLGRRGNQDYSKGPFGSKRDFNRNSPADGFQEEPRYGGNNQFNGSEERYPPHRAQQQNKNKQAKTKVRRAPSPPRHGPNRPNQPAPHPNRQQQQMHQNSYQRPHQAFENRNNRNEGFRRDINRLGRPANPMIFQMPFSDNKFENNINEELAFLREYYMKTAELFNNRHHVKPTSKGYFEAKTTARNRQDFESNFRINHPLNPAPVNGSDQSSELFYTLMNQMMSQYQKLSSMLHSGEADE